MSVQDSELQSGAICWPEQYPGEYAQYQRAMAKADIEYPGRRAECCSWNSDYWPCRHCQVCHRFVSEITGIFNGWGLIAVYGTCKDHGRQCVDSGNWENEYFEGLDDCYS